MEIPTEKFDAVVVLGGGKVSIPRAEKGVELYNSSYNPLFIASGGRGDSLLEAVVIEQFALEHGVDPTHIRRDLHSLNTIDNACLTKLQILDREPGVRNVGVVTSFEHMTRTRKVFERVMGIKYQVEVIGVPHANRPVALERISQAWTDYLLDDIEPGDAESALRRNIYLHPRHAGFLRSFARNVIDPIFFAPVHDIDSGQRAA